LAKAWTDKKTKMEERDINPTESLNIIQSMVSKTQRQYSDDSFYYIMWGWLALGAALGHFILLKMNIEQAPVVWFLMPVGGIVSMIYGAKQSKKEKIKTYVSTYMGYLWGAMGIAMAVTLSMMFKLGVENTYPILILIYGIGTFVSGGLLSFRPLIIGGIICFLLSVGAFFVSFQIQLLFIAGAMLVSYIIPGHLLKAKFSH
jgi:hypothetical protein